MRKLLLATAGLASAYLLLCLAVFALQRHLIFHPDTRDVALDVGRLPGASVVTFTTTDNEKLQSWWLPPRNASFPVYLYLPGNAETLANRAERFALLTRDGAGLLAVSWRGYGGSTGQPTEAGLQRDAVAAYDWLALRVKPEQVIVFGESVGSAAAVTLMAAHDSGALVLDAAYPSLLAVAQARLPWLPTALLMRDEFDALAWAPQITVPVVQRHCSGDWILPYVLAQQLFAAFGSSDKQFVTVENRCHLPALAPLLDHLRRLEQLLRSVEA
jgi:pimeloyl-ACP methyl ester carboxylesterase